MRYLKKGNSNSNIARIHAFLKRFSEDSISLRQVLMNWCLLFLISVLIFSIIIHVAIYFFIDILIDPVDVPESFKSQGYSGQVMAKQILDEVNMIGAEAKTILETQRRKYELSWTV